MQRTAGSTLNAARGHLRFQGEILLQGSATVICRLPLLETALEITAMVQADPPPVHTGFSLCPCQP